MLRLVQLTRGTADREPEVPRFTTSADDPAPFGEDGPERCLDRGRRHAQCASRSAPRGSHGRPACRARAEKPAVRTRLVGVAVHEAPQRRQSLEQRASGGGIAFRREPRHHRPSVERLVLDAQRIGDIGRTGGKGSREPPLSPGPRRSRCRAPAGRVASARVWSSAGSRPRMFARARRSSLLSWVGTRASSPSKARRRARNRRARARGDGPPRPRSSDRRLRRETEPRPGRRTRRAARRRTALPIRWPSSREDTRPSGGCHHAQQWISFSRWRDDRHWVAVPARDEPRPRPRRLRDVPG